MGKSEKLGLLVTLKARQGKESALKDFLLGGLDIVRAEENTVSWFAFQIDKDNFGIYDTFENEAGRNEHLKGEVAQALVDKSDELLQDFDLNNSIQKVEILASNIKKGAQHKGLLVIMRAKDSQVTAVENFLQNAEAMVEEEPLTVSWYAIKLKDNRYGIFDSAADEEGRNAHLNGKVAAALLENAPDLLVDFSKEAIQKTEIIASK